MPRKRGVGTDLAFDTLQETYDEWLASVNELDINEKEAFVTKFDAIAEDAGKALTTSVEEFKMARTNWGANEATALYDALKSDYFELESTDD